MCVGVAVSSNACGCWNTDISYRRINESLYNIYISICYTFVCVNNIIFDLCGACLVKICCIFCHIVFVFCFVGIGLDHGRWLALATPRTKFVVRKARQILYMLYNIYYMFHYIMLSNRVNGKCAAAEWHARRIQRHRVSFRLRMIV